MAKKKNNTVVDPNATPEAQVKALEAALKQEKAQHAQTQKTSLAEIKRMQEELKHAGSKGTKTGYPTVEFKGETYVLPVKQWRRGGKIITASEACANLGIIEDMIKRGSALIKKVS